MKFDAGTYLEPLEYDLKPYSDAKGTVPEPPEETVAEFYVALAKHLEASLGEDRVGSVDMTDPYSVADLLASLTVEEHQQLGSRLLTIHAEVCGGHPTLEDMEKLPFRLRRAWFGAVQGWLRPEAGTPATNE